MAGHYEAQVRRAMLTVGDADVLNEMADGWVASIGDLDRVRGALGEGVRRLGEQEQLGERTRDAAVGAFREMREHLAEQQRLLARTARALNQAGDVIGEVKALVRAWDRAGAPQPPGPAPQPVADPDADQTAYLAEATRHHRASVRYAFQVQQREDEARAAWEELNRVFTRSEDAIRSAHGIPREEDEVDPPVVWPPVDWPGTPPPEPEPGWPPLPPWPPVRDTPGPTTSTGPDGHGTTTSAPPGPSHVPVPPATSDHGGSHPSSVGAPAAAHPHVGGHGSTPSTAVGGSAQSGVAYAPGHPAAAGLATPPATSGSIGPAGLPGLSGAMSSATGAAGAAGVAGGPARGGVAGAARTGSGSSAARAGQGSAQSGRSSRGAVGGKGSQQAAGRARTGSNAAGAKPGGSGAGAGSRGSRRKDRSAARRDDLLATDEHWLDDEGTAPDVLR